MTKYWWLLWILIISLLYFYSAHTDRNVNVKLCTYCYSSIHTNFIYYFHMLNCYELAWPDCVVAHYTLFEPTKSHFSHRCNNIIAMVLCRKTVCDLVTRLCECFLTAKLGHTFWSLLWCSLWYPRLLFGLPTTSDPMVVSFFFFFFCGVLCHFRIKN